MKYSAAIFDLDGVICFTDKYHYQAWKAMADEEGIYFDEKINNRLRGVSRMESLEIILERADKKYSESEKLEMTELFLALNDKLNLEYWYREWTEKADKVFFPIPNECNVLPQDSTYLTLKDIDLSKYMAQDFVGGIFRDYNLTQINQIQVSKQADVLVLFFLLEDLFPHEVKKATWEYYSRRTTHDSSLSLCTHAVLAADMEAKEEAYQLFRKSTEIDLRPVMTTSNAGVHTASFGGIWQGAVYGFGGLRMLGGKLRIKPLLPEEWTKLEYTIIWHGQNLDICATHDKVTVKNLTGLKPVEIELCGQAVQVRDEVSVCIPA